MTDLQELNERIIELEDQLEDATSRIKMLQYLEDEGTTPEFVDMNIQIARKVFGWRVETYTGVCT